MTKDLGAGMAYGKAKGDGAPYCGTVFRLYPNRTQAAQMEAMFALVDEAYDELLAFCVQKRSGGYKAPAEWYVEKAIERGSVLGDARYGNLPSDVRDHVLRSVLQALDARPLDDPPAPRTERSDRYRGSYTGKPSGSAFVADPRHVVLPYVDGLVKARVSREVGHAFSVTVRREPDGKYYASALSRRPVPRSAPSKDRAVVVSSLGTEVLVELDDGTTWDAPRSWERSQERLRELDRLLFPLKEGTPERERLRLRRARLHAHVANIRRDYIHKVTDAITRDYAEVVVPRPNFAALVEQVDESALVNDAAWGELVRQLEYKCKWRGRAFREADRYEVVEEGGRPVVRPA